MKTASKYFIAAAATLAVATASLTPVAVNAWGDSANGRASYTISQINSGVLGNTITFNSISDSKIGDEKNFVAAKKTSSTASTWNANEITAEDGETYTIRLYVHNNSPKGTNAVAKDVTAWFSLPTTVGTEQTVIGYLQSSNATPTRYWDEVKFTSSEDFYLEYVEGSAQYTNAKMGTVSLSNNVISETGALLGYSSLNGEIPGCYTYDGVVTIQVKVHKSVNSKLVKTVRIKNSGNKFAEAVDAKIGDEVEFQIAYTNLLEDTVSNVMIRDILPTNMEYVANSTYLYNSKYQSGVLLSDNTVTTTGINIGSYKANGNAYVRFTAKVVDKTLACGTNQLVNWANATVNSRVVKDDASVIVSISDSRCDTKKDDDTPKKDDDTPKNDDTKKEETKTDDNKSDETPSTLPSTGATDVAGIALGSGSVVTLAGYAISRRKKLM